MNRYSTRFGAVCAIAFVVASDLAGCSGDDDADTGASTSSGASGAAGTSATGGSAGRASASTPTSSTTAATGGAGGGGAGGDAGDGGAGGAAGATGGGGAGGSQMGGGGNGGDRAGAGGMDAGRDGDAAGRDGGSDGSVDARTGDAHVDGGSDARETGGDAQNDVIRSDSSTTDGSSTDAAKDTSTDNASPDGTSLDASSDGASPDVSSDGPPLDASGGPCTTNANCAAGWFCSKPICLAASGTCKPKPVTCSNVQSPTCGCDKVTYWNDCVREQAGTASSSSGVCLVPALCGGPDHLACPTQGAVCSYTFGSQAECQVADPSGNCWMPPSACPAIAVGAGWRLCGGDAGACVSDCEPLQSGLKYYLDETCPQ